MFNTTEVLYISSSLPSIIVDFFGQNGEFFYFRDKILRDKICH